MSSGWRMGLSFCQAEIIAVEGLPVDEVAFGRDGDPPAGGAENAHTIQLLSEQTVVDLDPGEGGHSLEEGIGIMLQAAEVSVQQHNTGPTLGGRCGCHHSSGGGAHYQYIAFHNKGVDAQVR